MSAYDDYWEEAVSCSLEDNGVSATPEQIKAVSQDILWAHENIGMAFPLPSGPSPIQRELDKANAELSKEREMIVCRECRGSGTEIINGPSHYSRSTCWKCNGRGRHSP